MKNKNRSLYQTSFQCFFCSQEQKIVLENTNQIGP